MKSISYHRGTYNRPVHPSMKTQIVFGSADNYRDCSRPSPTVAKHVRMADHHDQVHRGFPHKSQPNVINKSYHRGTTNRPVHQAMKSQIVFGATASTQQERRVNNPGESVDCIVYWFSECW